MIRLTAVEVEFSDARAFYRYNQESLIDVTVVLIAEKKREARAWLGPRYLLKVR